jgi:hypothetical protein
VGEPKRDLAEGGQRVREGERRDLALRELDRKGQQQVRIRRNGGRFLLEIANSVLGPRVER